MHGLAYSSIHFEFASNKLRPAQPKDKDNHSNVMSVSNFSCSVIERLRSAESNLMSNTVNGSSQDSGVQTVPREGQRQSITQMIPSREVFLHQGDPTDRLDFSGMPVSYVEQIYRDFEAPNSDSNNESQCHGVCDGPVDVTPNTSCFRSSRWWDINPAFGSPIIERYWKKKVFEFLHRRYRIAMSLICLFGMIWVVFFSISPTPDPDLMNNQNEKLALYYSVNNPKWYILGAAIFFVSMFFLLTLTAQYPKFAFVLSLVLVVFLMVCSWALPVAVNYSRAYGATFMIQFTITTLVILVIYTFSRLPLSLSTALGLVYVIVLEVLTSKLGVRKDMAEGVGEAYTDLSRMTTASRCMFYMCLIVAGLTSAFLSQTRLRATFGKIVQCVLSEKVLELEKQ